MRRKAGRAELQQQPRLPQKTLGRGDGLPLRPRG